MRNALVALVAFCLLPMAAAVEPFVILVDWQEGRALAGTSALAMSPMADAFPFTVGPCHRALLLDLLYDPQEGGARIGGVGELFLKYDFLVELARSDGGVTRVRVRDPSYGIPLGTTPAEGAHEIRLSLANGADVSWSLRVRGRSIPGELACEPRIVLNEVEADPPGTDAGNEWIELYNAGDETADLSLWTVTAMHGAAVLTLPQGTSLLPGAHFVIVIPSGQALDDADEVIQLSDAFGRLRDTTPPLSDGLDSNMTWQRAPDGGAAWVFSSGTPGAPNASS